MINKIFKKRFLLYVVLFPTPILLYLFYAEYPSWLDTIYNCFTIILIVIFLEINASKPHKRLKHTIIFILILATSTTIKSVYTYYFYSPEISNSKSLNKIDTKNILLANKPALLDSNENQPVKNLNSTEKSESIKSNTKIESSPQDVLTEAEVTKIENTWKPKFKQIFDLARNKDWDALIEFSSSIESPYGENTRLSKGLMTLSLSQAIMRGAPKDIILKIINQGAELTPDIVFAAAARQDVPIMEMLVGYGLDIHARDANGRTALYYSLVDLDNLSMFDYLMANGVSTTIVDIEHDLMSFIIDACSPNLDNVKHVMDALTAAGEVITLKHRRRFIALGRANHTCARRLMPFFRIE